MNRRNFFQAAGVGSTGLLAGATALAGAEPHAKGTHEAETAFEFLGRSNQDGPELTHFGYLTHVFGLEDGLLFANPNLHTAATAHLTFLATTTLDSRHQHGNIITTSAPGEMTLFLNQNPAGDFDDPASFGLGQAFATYETRYYNVLNVQAPNQGVTTATVELTQLKHGGFTVGKHRFHWGRTGLRLRLSAAGQGTRTQPDPLQAFFLVGGQAVVVDP
jgi:hypothetical protein